MKNENKKVALFGGSFNPVQSAHVGIVQNLMNNGKVDEVWLLPCGDHPFGKKLVSGEDRVAMIGLAMDGLGAKVCREDLDSDGISLTYDTVRRLKDKFPGNEFYWVCGRDILGEYDKWEKGQELLREVQFIVFDRPGYCTTKVEGMDIYFNFSVDLGNASSSLVRENVLKGKSLDGLVCGKVEEYIGRNNLYGN